MEHEIDVSGIDGYAKLAQEAVRYIEKMPECILRNMIVAELAKRTKIDVTRLLDKGRSSHVDNSEVYNNRSPSAIRSAITLLVQNPELAQTVDDWPPELDLPGFKLFNSLLQFLTDRPEATTGAIIENWRDNEDGKHLSKLATCNITLSGEAIRDEFLGAIAKLHKIANENKVNMLLNRAAQGELTADEKVMLQELIRDK